MRTAAKKIKQLKIRKKTIAFLIVTSIIAFVGWLLFLIFFGRVDPIVRSTTSNDPHLYNYGLVSLPLWIYTFTAPILYPVIILYICNGNWQLGILGQIAGASMSMILGAVLNMSSSLFHVVRNIDTNNITINICFMGLIGILAAMINLIVMLIFIPVFDRMSGTKLPPLPALEHEVKPLTRVSYSDFSDNESVLYTKTDTGNPEPPPRPPPPRPPPPAEIPHQGSATLTVPSTARRNSSQSSGGSRRDSRRLSQVSDTRRVSQASSESRRPSQTSEGRRSSRTPEGRRSSRTTENRRSSRTLENRRPSETIPATSSPPTHYNLPVDDE